MNGTGESDRPIVPRKLSNNGAAAAAPAEGAEGRGLAKENLLRQNQPIGHRAAPGWQNALERIRQAAKKDKDVHLQDLSGRLHRGAYHAKPVQRVYIPKPDGRQRPIGIPTLEDKLVQRAAVKVLSAVYEADFMGFSYGFRPNRGCHDALDALAVGISDRKVNWVLDVDIRGFFDTLSHEWLVKFVEHRIADRRVVRHIKKWLNAGVLEDGKRMQVEEGTPQGGSSTPQTILQTPPFLGGRGKRGWTDPIDHSDFVMVHLHLLHQGTDDLAA